MQSGEIRQKFLTFFEKRGHVVVPSASLVPENDPSVLFTTAGMQQFKPYYLGKLSPYGNNVVSVQKCVRTSDIDEVGDESHLTFFEMLGNFSFGGYWKKEAIEYAYEFVTKEMELTIDYVTIFGGDERIPADTESEEMWKSIAPNITIKKCGRADNFWGPTGGEGPCGPTTEIYINGIEIWNIVFNEYYQGKDNTFKPLEIKGIDTGLGLERLTMVSQGKANLFETDLFPSHPKTREEKIVADHSRTINALLEENLKPSNKDQGYVLRRLMRRVLIYKKQHNLKVTIDSKVFNEERKKFGETLEKGMKEIEKGADPFLLASTYGFPLELLEEMGIKVDRQRFEEDFKKHQEISKVGMKQKFKGGLGGHSDMEIKYHTATHLLRQALENVLNEKIEQKGSNINPERLRFDFTLNRKMTDEEKKKVEDLVNQKILENLPVKKVVMSREEAEKTGVTHVFGEKYGDEISIYYVGNSLETAYSKEFCGGPHVKNTNILGKFKIIKEEAVSAGVRRIKAVLE
ncbi:MAG: alanine--tRNA ligase-related protein [bacterium]